MKNTKPPSSRIVIGKFTPILSKKRHNSKSYVIHALQGTLLDLLPRMNSIFQIPLVYQLTHSGPLDN